MAQSIHDAKCLYDLPAGTVFYVENGGWNGVVMEKDDKKYMSILGIHDSLRELTPDHSSRIAFGSWGKHEASDVDLYIRISDKHKRQAAETYLALYGYQSRDFNSMRKHIDNLEIDVDITEYDDIVVMIWCANINCYISSGEYSFSKIAEAEKAVLAALDKIRAL